MMRRKKKKKKEKKKKREEKGDTIIRAVELKTLVSYFIRCTPGY